MSETGKFIYFNEENIWYHKLLLLLLLLSWCFATACSVSGEFFNFFFCNIIFNATKIKQTRQAATNAIYVYKMSTIGICILYIVI